MKNFAFFISILLLLSACNQLSTKKKGLNESETIASVQTESSKVSSDSLDLLDSEDSNKELEFNDNSCFVKGVSNFKLYKPSIDEHNNGVTYEYIGRNLKIRMFYYQIGLYAQLIDEYGEKINMGYDDILSVLDQDYDYEEFYKDWEYAITQHDIDSDGKDEIIIASRIKNGACTPVGIFIYRIKDGKKWNLKAPETWWDMQVIIVNNHVKVEPNHYGFTYDWAFEDDRFIDHGEY